MISDKKSEKILKLALSKYNGNMDEDISIYPSELELDYTEVNSACKNLKELGYFKLYIYSYSRADPVTLQLSHNGLHYFEHKRKDNLFLCMKSIWMPIIVSLLTNLIISVPKWLLPLIQQWLTHNS